MIGGVGFGRRPLLSPTPGGLLPNANEQETQYKKRSKDDSIVELESCSGSELAVGAIKGSYKHWHSRNAHL